MSGTWKLKDEKPTLYKAEFDDLDRLTEERWRAIIQNDASWDAKFFYGVISTGIFCRPSCKSRIPKRGNVRIFFNKEEALAEHFRPCKRCRPDRLQLPDEEWAAHIAAFIEKNYGKDLTLDVLAQECHGSPYHMQRTFKRVMGLTPSDYLRELRLEKAEQLLKTTAHPVAEIASAVGITNTAYFATLFKKRTGLTPTEFRKMNSTK